MIKSISFYTLTGRKFENIQFDEDSFFDYMEACGVHSINSTHQVILFLNNLFESELEINPYDSVCKIEYECTKDFLDRYEMMDNVLKYNL